MLTLICLGINAYSDLKTRESFTFFYLIVYATGFLLTRNLWAIVFAAITLLGNKDRDHIGGGDLDAILLVVFAMGLNVSIQVLLISCIAAILYSVFKGNSMIPFVTMIFIGYTLTFFDRFVF